MAKLIVNPTSASRREIALPRTLLSIGRDPGNDLVLPDAMVSRRHAVIECRGTQYFIRDCNSSNGSLVNGDKVSERSLRDGDLVAIGTARLLFRDDFEVDAGAKVVQHPSSPRLHCSACGADYRKGDQFCRQCGASVAPSLPPKAICAACGTAVLLPAQFCTACGRGLGDAAAASAPVASPAAVAPLDKTYEPALAPAPPSTEETPPIASPPSAGARISDATALPAERPGTPSPLRDAALRAPAQAAPRPARRFPDTFRERVASGPVRSPDAGAMARLGAALVDHGIAGLAQTLVLAPVVWYWWSRPIPVRSADAPLLPVALSATLVPVAVLLGCAYFIYGWGVRGATPGKALLGLAVEGEDGTFPIGVARATGRLFAYALSSVLLGLGHVMILFGGAALHDRVAGTRVVRRERP
jgi:uncharacterized RDD family membrane protein YckC